MRCNYTYSAFGELDEQTGTTDNQYRFAGEHFDEETGDYYLRQRQYDVGTGRFSRKDTYEGRLNEPLSLHKYLYTQANPVNSVDPTGWFTMTEISAANSLRGILSEIQIDIGQQLINEVGGDDNPLVQFLNQTSAAVDFFNTAVGLIGAGGLLVGAVQSGRVNLPRNQRPSTRYQKLVTGKDYEEVWTLNSGTRINVDGHPENYLVEVKWTGKNDRAWSSSPYNPRSRYYNESKFLDQTQRYLQLNMEEQGKGVRYAFSNMEAVQHYERLFGQRFPEEMANGTLKVFHVPGNGM